MIARTFWRIHQSVSLIAGARRATEVLMGGGIDLLQEEAQRATNQVFSIAKSMAIPLGTLQRGTMERKVFEHQTTALNTVIDSALMITMHALVDDVLCQLIHVIIRAAPVRCAHFVDSKKIELRAAREKTYRALLQERLLEYGESVDRLSLPAKVELLLSALRPQPGSLNTAEHTFSIEHLAELDALRHDLVHGGGPRRIPDLKADLDYLQFVAYTLWAATSQSSPGLLEGFAKSTPFPQNSPPR